MIALTESRKLELIEECKKVMNVSSPDGDIYPIYAIALESLTAVPTYSRYRLSAKGSGPDAEKSPWFAGYGKALRESHDVEVGNLFTSPPVPEIKLPTEQDFEVWFKSIEAGDDPDWSEPNYLSKEWHEYLARHQLALGAYRLAIGEIKRLNGLGE